MSPNIPKYIERGAISALLFQGIFLVFLGVQELSEQHPVAGLVLIVMAALVCTFLIGVWVCGK